MKIAAAPLIYLFGDASFEIVKLSETANTITFGWIPPEGINGYRFTREKAPIKPNGVPTYSHTWNAAQDKVTFSKDSAWYSVEALTVSHSAKGS